MNEMYSILLPKQLSADFMAYILAAVRALALELAFATFWDSLTN